MSDRNSALSDAGPDPRPSADWSFAPRPGRYSDAAEVRLADTEYAQLKLGAIGFIWYTLGQLLSWCSVLRAGVWRTLTLRRWRHG